MVLKETLLRQIRRLGINISKFPDADLRRRITLLNNFKISKILDVGANSGQYSKLMKELGFKGEIISFEPLSDTFKKLREESEKYNNWTAVNIALGEMDGVIQINVSKNSYSSSILKMLPLHFESAPASIIIRKEMVKISKLDTIFNNFCKDDDKVFLKIDTQGYEIKVLEGAREAINKITGVHLEMSLIPLYEGEALFSNMLFYMKDLGFDLCSLENGFYNKTTGQLLQVDGIFFRHRDNILS
jgi:FkbM family methyltransferase